MNVFWLILFIMCLILLLTFIDYSMFTPNNSVVSVINPMSGFTPVPCSSVRTPCNPNDPQSCNNSCTEQGLTCTNLSAFQSSISGNVNGGGYVCLPETPLLECNLNNGGALTWTGYGFTDSANWSCLCTHPEFFGGPSCETLNPSFCSGGTVTVDPTKPFLAGNMCACPSGTSMLYRDNNIPLCVPTSSVQGKQQGVNGLAGNRVKDSWINIYINPNPTDNNLTWATKIATYLNPTQKSVNSIQSYLTSSTNGKNLTQLNANALCGFVEPGNLGNNAYCSSNSIAKNFNIPVVPEAIYTYYPDTYLP